MAKRATKKQKEEPASGQERKADSLFAQVCTNVTGRLKRTDEYTAVNDERQQILHVLPLPALSARYALQNEGLPLSCVYVLAGEPASFKSTMLAEFFRWHRICGGLNVLCEAETKEQKDLRDAILNYDKEAVRVEACESLEDWQQRASWYTEEFKKRCNLSGGPGAAIPLCIGVDSLTGKANRATITKVAKAGHATLAFPQMANLINQYFQVFPSWIGEWPITLVGVNHLKKSLDPTTGMEIKRIPGGAAVKFHTSMGLELSKFGKVKQFAQHHEANIQMQTFKNSYGPEEKRIQVRLKIWKTEDAPGVFRDHARFEWWEASVLLLQKGVGMRKTVADILLPRIKEIISIRDKSGGSKGKLFWSKDMDIPESEAMSAHNLGVQLEHRQDMLEALYPLLGIKRRPFFQPGVDLMVQREEYKHVAAQAEAANRKIEEEQAIVAGVEETTEDEQVMDE